MKLSVIIPAFNCKSTLNRAVQSALSQSITDLEVIIVDDGSTDGTSEYADLLDSRWRRVRTIHQKNKGPSEARARGLEEAKGEWATFLDADDFVNKRAYEKLINACITEKVNMATCNFTIHRESNLNVSRWKWIPGKYNVQDNLIWTTNQYDIGFCCGKMYNTKALRKLNIPFPNCDLVEDSIWNAEIFYLMKEMVIIDDPDYNYVIYDNSLSHKKLTVERRMKTINCVEELYNKYKGKKGFDKYWETYKSFIADTIARKAGDSIDLVVPYVDCNDKNWYKLYKQYNDNIDDVDIRFNNNGMFPLFWRCLAHNLQDVDVIHLVVQSESQIPAWLDRNKVHIVTHDMFMPKKALPTFNSSAIEMYIQNILGLSNNFIYANDDFYVTTKLSAKTFFDGNKILNTYTPKKFLDSDSVQLWEDTFANATKLAYNGKLLKEGVDYYTMEHTIRAFNRLRMKEVYSMFKKDIDRSVTQFREYGNMNIFLFGVYDYVKGNALNRRNYKLEVLSTNDLDELKEKFRSGPQITCINDTEISKDPTEIREYFRSLFKSPCIYEVYDSM